MGSGPLEAPVDVDGPGWGSHRSSPRVVGTSGTGAAQPVGGAGAPAPSAQRVWEPGVPIDLARTLGGLRRGRADPCMTIGPGGVWRATRTPEGPATTHITADRTGGRTGGVRVRAWGPGASWAVSTLPALVGADDPADEFATVELDPVVGDLRRRHPGIRMCRSQAVFEALMPSIIEQKVVGLDARDAYAALVRRIGEPAPEAPGAPARLMVPPDPATVAATPSYVFHQCNIERKRADTIRGAALYAHRLEETLTMPVADFYRRITALPGVGPWTAAEVAAVALGDADAVSVGDYHLPNFVAWALAGEARADDARMLELLEPYRPHRGRVVKLLIAGIKSPGGRGAPPKFGPRMPRQSIASI